MMSCDIDDGDDSIIDPNLPNDVCVKWGPAKALEHGSRHACARALLRLAKEWWSLTSGARGGILIQLSLPNNIIMTILFW